jgi:hypothetical protein
MMFTANGFVLYRGPSAIDGSPIVCIASGLFRPSPNVKTGPMVQVYILVDGKSPLQAAQDGSDSAICGDCSHRGKIVTNPATGVRKNVERSCYVTLMHGPRVVYDGYQRGIYPEVTPAEARKMLAKRKVRLGAYGDPGAVPVAIWDQVLDRVSELSGYTHLWKKIPTLSAFCMASVDTEAERAEAKELGFRTFRVRRSTDPTLKGEGHCPGSDEMKNAVQCVACLLCGGKRSNAKADITTIVHGTGSKNFERALELA